MKTNITTLIFALTLILTILCSNAKKSLRNRDKLTNNIALINQSIALVQKMEISIGKSDKKSTNISQNELKNNSKEELRKFPNFSKPATNVQVMRERNKQADREKKKRQND